MKKVAVVQARYASTRLPGKILKKLPYDGQETALEQVVKRLKRSQILDDVVVATTTEPEDDEVAALCDLRSIAYHRGSMNDVLSRYFGAAEKFCADIIVRVTSDCPCFDVTILDDMLSGFSSEFMSNVHPRVLPHGLDAEIFTFEALKNAHENAADNYDREHVTPYIIRNASNQSYAPAVSGGSDIRITLDRREDYAILCAVYDNLYKDNEYFGLSEILRLFEEKPWLKMINENVKQKKQYENLDEELKDAIDLLNTQELRRAAKVLEEQ